ncbi:MAG: UvrB/UvrC motif-containing protein [Minisyncoccia bacterium]
MTREELTRYDIPDEPGVYRFCKGSKVLYVGKATSLKDRVKSYFSKDLSETRSPAIAGMIIEADTLTWETTESVLEALILEANTIKKLEPRYNTDEKDNKSFNYLVITKEAFPRLAVVRGRELFGTWEGGAIKHLFGPFPSGGALQEALKLVRKIFPYRDAKCTPGQEKPCFNRQIGLCPGVCTGEVSAREYAGMLQHIVLLFSGKKKALLRTLEKEMTQFAKKEDFEAAVRARRQVAALQHIRDVALIKEDSRFSGGGVIGSRSKRIEAYDVAHTGGSETVAVMVVIEEGELHKSEYRKFKIKEVTNDDPGALSEVLMRRFMHPEWPYPQLIILDGGTAQMNAAKKVLAKAGIRIPLVGVVKDERHRPERLIGDAHAIKMYEKEILLANSEAHRFAITYHKKRRSKSMLE